MNILCIDQFATWGGGQRSLLDLLPSFREQGWKPHIALPGEGRFSEELDRLGYATSILRSGSFTSIRKPLREIWRYAWETPRLARKLLRLTDDLGADLLYVNGPRVLPTAAWVARQRNIPLVFHCHHLLGQWSAIQMTRAALRHANASVIACCEYAVKPVKTAVDESHIFVIYNGVLSAGDVKARQVSEIKRIGVIGRIEKEKGQLDFVLAARMLAKRFPKCEFTIAGSPMFSNNEYYGDVVTASYGLPVKFIEWQDDVARIFADLDLVVAPSTHLEATTRVILEAFAYGVPVVARPAGGIPEVINDNETGFLAADATVEALARRIQEVLEMPVDEVSIVTKRARRAWQDNFTLSRYRREVCQILYQAGGSSVSAGCRGLSAVYTTSAKTDQ